MRIPRIKLPRTSLIFDDSFTHWTVRYGVAVAAAALPSVISFLLGEHLGVEFYLLCIFATVLLASVLGGLGPGLVTTGLAVLLGFEVSRWRITLDEFRLLAIEGALVSIGGTLRAALIKARDRVKSSMRVEQQILEISDEERRRIGHDLHDGLGQHLTGISMLSGTIAQQIEAGQLPKASDIETITRLVGDAISITRDLAKSLSPITLTTEGLPAALSELAETCSSLFSINCTCESTGQNLEIDQARSLHLFRIVQEAVNNSVRHGEAKNVRIGLLCDGRRLKVTVQDDGVGLSMKTSSQPGLGLRIMQHRARMLGASLTVERAALEGGTIVTCNCPLGGELPLS